MERPRELIPKIAAFLTKHFPALQFRITYAKRLGSGEGVKVQVKFSEQMTVEELLSVPNPRTGR
jgi:hypothetical protein